MNANSTGAAPGYPPVAPNLLFPKPPQSAIGGLMDAAKDQAERLTELLTSFELPVEVREVKAGPATTRIGFKLGKHANNRPVRVTEVEARRKDIALELGSRDLRVVSPLLTDKGESLVGVEVNHTHQVPIPLAEALHSPEFKNDPRPLKFAVGMDVTGKFVVESLADCPHLLVAGTTGSGKSIWIHSLIMQLLMQYRPEELRLVLADPKRIELGFYNGVPHVYSPPSLLNQANNEVLYYAHDLKFALMYFIKEMDSRYITFQLLKLRDIAAYNQHAAGTGQDPMQYLVMIVDEFADLFDALGEGKEANAARNELAGLMKRIAQKGRAAGIHLVFGTQRPSVDVVKGNIKTNFPSRIAFRLPTAVDSEVILDVPGAEILRGKGDMLYSSANAAVGLQRLQGMYVPPKEIKQVVDYWVPAAAGTP